MAHHSVQRRQNHVPVSAAFIADFRRFKVANPRPALCSGSCRRSAQRRGEVQPDLLLHLHLVDALN